MLTRGFPVCCTFFFELIFGDIFEDGIKMPLKSLSRRKIVQDRRTRRTADTSSIDDRVGALSPPRDGTRHVPGYCTPPV